MPKGFLLAEDAAVKARFSSITVTDDRNAERPVGVFFRYPEGETEKKYPFITIELIDIAHDTSRQQSETSYYYGSTASASARNDFINYYPSELNANEMASQVQGSNYLRLESFVPVTLVYQISTFARSALHDRQLTSKILRRVMPFRRGFIDIPEDGTIRRFDMGGWASADILDQEAGFKKRIFRKVFTVQMTAEMPTSDLVSIKRVTSVVGTINNADVANPTIFTDPFSEEF